MQSVSGYDWLLKMPFAHRGLHNNSNGVPENSIPAFEKAIEKNYSIELDVHLLNDGKLAVFHDDTLNRMCGKAFHITALNSTDLNKYPLLITEYTIPLLDEVLELVNDRVPLLIELKNKKKPGLPESTLAGVLNNYTGRYAVQSFNPFSLQWLAKQAPHIIRGQLSGNFKGENMNWLVKKALQYLLFMNKSRPAFIAYDHHALPNRRLQHLRNNNIPVIAWTIRSPEEYAQVSSYCDNIIFENFYPAITTR